MLADLAIWRCAVLTKPSCPQASSAGCKSGKNHSQTGQAVEWTAENMPIKNVTPVEDLNAGRSMIEDMFSLSSLCTCFYGFWPAVETCTWS